MYVAELVDAREVSQIKTKATGWPDNPNVEALLHAAGSSPAVHTITERSLEMFFNGFF